MGTNRKNRSVVSVKAAFDAAKVTDVVDAFKHICNQTEEYLPVAGPLPKNTYTYQLEFLTQKLLSMERFYIKNSDGEYQIIFDDGTQLDLTKILAHANFEQLEFKLPDFQQYEQYIYNHSQYKPDIENVFPSEEQFRANDKTGALRELNYAEMMAINLYTTQDYYKNINAFTRGTYTFEDRPEWIRDVILHTVMSASGLAKAQEVTIPGSFRYESVYSEEALKQRIDLAESGGISIERNFISSAEIPAERFVDKIAITYTDVKGKCIAPLSAYPQEREFLIPPTQMQWKNHTQEGDTHYFHASPVVDLQKVHEEALEMTSLEMQTNYQLMFLSNHVLMLRKQLESLDSDIQEALEPKLAEMEQWINEHGIALGEGTISSEEVSQSLDGIWNQLSEVSEEAQILQNKQFIQENAVDTAYSSGDFKTKLSEIKQEAEPDHDQEYNFKL
ncbi:hypothetical protein [Legionella bononiensis]|uniref:Uncharacterized protein n=1 Tax=Legionella bononiensis TaxID=2793102 RepID=A0ABS1W760_9GAMM|nr:hypothetical protein [Legionella bononiensis]MBL7478448.1 hypothetical protein [Legionella bononiensis]MBL7525045.1 hypothetical protein [Legionella bononiensis]MBL7561341.1 hypothetical protein [Legionella bononiensis]